MTFKKVTDEVASAYNNWSETYEGVENRTRDLAAAELRRTKLTLENRDALEIGCGTGVNTGYLADNCRCIRAVDFSEGMLAQAREKLSSQTVHFQQSDIRLPWKLDDSSVDVIVCTLVLEHLKDLSHVFAEARRVLRAGGDFLIYELHPYRQLRGGQAQYQDRNSGEIVYVPAFQHSVSEFVNSAIEAGFDIFRIGEAEDKRDHIEKAGPRLFSMHLR